MQQKDLPGTTDPVLGNPLINGLPSIRLGQLEISGEDAATLGVRSARTITLFGGTLDTGEEWEGIRLFRNELLVIEDIGDARAEHQLAQRNHPIYSAPRDKTCSEAGDMFNMKRFRSLRRPPRWKQSDAEIPVREEVPFVFLAQFYVKSTKAAVEHFGAGQTIYLFALADEDRLTFQAFLQDTSEQTAEDHYRLEEQMMEFDRDYADIAKVEALIASGDKYLHQYISEHPRSRAEVLVILLPHAKTKKLKQQIQKRLDRG